MNFLIGQNLLDLVWDRSGQANYKGKDFRLESDVSEYGFKMHMNDISASIGIANLPYLETNLSKMRQNARLYEESQPDLPGLTLLKTPDEALSSYWLFSFNIQNKLEFIDYMKDQGIIASRVIAANNRKTLSVHLSGLSSNLDRVEKTFVSIPCRLVAHPR